VGFQYEDTAGGDRGFALGPIDFSLYPGELVFVVGGNGSGKSTFVKILCGLYAPQSGELRASGQLVEEAGRAAYRERFAVVFSDCFLFGKLLGLDSPEVEPAARQYLQLLQMDHKVNIRDRQFSTTEL